VSKYAGRSFLNPVDRSNAVKPARTRQLAAALCVSLALCGCNATAAGGGAVSSTIAVRDTTQAATPQDTDVAFGEQVLFESGLSVTVSMPKLFRPSPSAYPRSERAAAFEIAVNNGSTQSYRLSGLAVEAEVAGEQMKQVVDPTQGISGIVDAGKDVPPGRQIRVTVAFAVAPEPAPIRLKLRPDATEEPCATYTGTV
jgi:hypothetical protein